jgi:hypothetical protein
VATVQTKDDEDKEVLRLFMRPEEDLREHRQRVPWRGEYRLFRSPSVVKLEDYRPPDDMRGVIDRLRDGRGKRRS